MTNDIIQRLGTVLLSSARAHRSANEIEVSAEEVHAAVGGFEWICQSNLKTKTIATDLSSQFLDMIRGGARDYALGLSRLIPAEQDDLIAEASQRSREVLTCIKERRKPTISPWTGGLSYAHHSLGREWYLFEENNQYCLVSTLGETSFFAFRDMIWVFPQTGVIIALENGHTEEWVRREVASEFFLILSHSKQLIEYLDCEHSSVGVADFWCPHISHNLWNMLSGWENVLSALPPGSIDRVFTFDGQALYGSISDLYLDKINSGSVSLFTTDAEIFKYMLDENLFLASVKDEYITSSLALRVLDLARRESRVDFLEAASQFRSAHKYLVLITIRAGNRSWVGQEDGLPDLMMELSKVYDDVGFIIDGLSADASMGWTTGWLSLHEDKRVLKTIRKALPAGFPIFDGVGRLFSESIVLADLCDFFVAPIGSGMALYKWISNKPGVAFSNSAVLDKEGHLFNFHREWDRNRSDIIEAAYLSHEKVADVSSSHEAISRLNFTMNWRDLYEIVVAEIGAHRHDAV